MDYRPAVGILAAALLVSCNARNEASASAKQIIVLGIDGMDPGFLERHWDALPHLNRMRQEGDFRRLETTNPPQSPVAWSSFLTGLDPGGHGIYDFVHRDPDTMTPYSAMSRTTGGGRRLGIGPYLLPLTSGHADSLRHGTVFWKTLGDHGIPATILRMPTNFPPAETEGRSLAGMGTPDLRGTFGTFSYFTDDDRFTPGTVPGGEIFRVQLRDGTVRLRLPGPANSLRKDNAATFVPIVVHVDREHAVARFDLGGRQAVLKEGEWSRWIPVRFSLVRGLADAPGMVRIYAQSLKDSFRVYISPVNIDPAEPALPLSDPSSYSTELSHQVGRFYTQGIAQDTAALRQGILTRAEYLYQSRDVSLQMLKLLRFEVRRFHSGLLFFHFFGVDQNSHILWGLDEDELLKTYRLVDETLGWVRQQAPKATVMVISDHGFARFDRAVHLNSWLRDAGLLTLKPGSEQKKQAEVEDIDWFRTKAYALGINGVYVNQQFRERDGTVAEGEETAAVIQQIREGLLTLRDPANGEPVVHSLVEPRRDFSGDSLDSAPDLIVGYYPGYRGSWQTALGSTPKALIEDNRDEWRGDHCIAAEFVPGVYLTNRPTGIRHPRLQDLGAQILAEFGIQEQQHVSTNHQTE